MYGYTKWEDKLSSVTRFKISFYKKKRSQEPFYEYIYLDFANGGCWVEMNVDHLTMPDQTFNTVDELFRSLEGFEVELGAALVAYL